MTMMRLPLFVWNSLCAMILIISAFPVLTATTFLLWLDRILGMHFFTAGSGGNQMLYFDLIWTWGHPEVYILVIPAFGMFSEIVSTFSQKKIFGYVSMVAAAIAITLLSYLVWLHHFFTMGCRRGRELVFRHCDDVDRHPFRSPGIQLDLDNVQGESGFSPRPCIGSRFCLDFLDRRHERRADGLSAG